LLHFETQDEPQSSTTLLNTSKQDAVIPAKKPEAVATTMLSTLQVFIFDKFGQATKTRAILDSGSQLNLISNRLATSIAAKRTKTIHKLTGIDGKGLKITQSIQATIADNSKTNQITEDFLIVSKISDYQPPAQSELNKELNIPGDVQLADPKLLDPTTIDLLLGVGVFSEIMVGNPIKLDGTGLTMFDTKFGYIVAGKIDDSKGTPALSHTLMINLGTAEIKDAFLQKQSKIRRQSEGTPTTEMPPIEDQPCQGIHYQDEIGDDVKMHDISPNVDNNNYNIKFKFTKNIVANISMIHNPLGLTMATLTKAKSLDSKQVWGQGVGDDLQIKNSCNRYRRPITKLAKLPILVTLLGLLAVLVRGQQISPLNSSTVYLSHIDEIKIQAGMWILNAHTNISIKADIDKIEQTVANFSKAIAKLDKQVSYKFKNEQKLLEQQAKITKEFILNTGQTSRTARSRGVLSFVSDFLFGSDDTATQIEALKEREENLESKAIKLGKQENSLIQAELRISHNEEILKKHMVEIESWAENSISKDDSYNKPYIMLKEIYQHAKDILQIYHEHYENIRNGGNLSEKDIGTLYDEYLSKNDLTGTMTSFKELGERLPVTKVIKTEDTIILRISIPLLYKEIFEELRIIPVPNEEHKIIQPYKDLIAVNHKLQMFFYPEKTENNLGKFKIIKNPALLKINTQNDCMTGILTNKKTICHEIKLKTPYEVFIPIQQGSYIFYRSDNQQTLDVICRSRIKVNYTKGIIRLDEGCRIETPNTEIWSNISPTLQKGYNYVLKLNNESTTIPTNQSRKYLHSDFNSWDHLQNEFEVNDLSTPNNSTAILAVSIFVMLTIILSVGGIVAWKFITNKRQKQEAENIEIETISTLASK
jgi:hypothetical protein